MLCTCSLDMRSSSRCLTTRTAASSWLSECSWPRQPLACNESSETLLYACRLLAGSPTCSLAACIMSLVLCEMALHGSSVWNITCSSYIKGFLVYRDIHCSKSHIHIQSKAQGCGPATLQMLNSTHVGKTFLGAQISQETQTLWQCDRLSGEMQPLRWVWRAASSWGKFC